MMKNPDLSIVGSDPTRFSEFVDANGLVCFQIQTTFSFREVPRMPIIRVSREVWLSIHDRSAPVLDRALTPDELLVEHVKLQAEVELQRLEPRVREYVRARQAFDTALMLKWAAVFTGPTAHPVMFGTHLEHSKVRPREASSGAHASSASSSSTRDQLSNDDPDDPEHSDQAELLRQLEAFKRQERAWRTDRLRLKQELELLELDKQRVVTNWTRSSSITKV
jgi:hypothetical protein